MKRRIPISKEIAFLLITVLLSASFGTYLSLKRVTDPFLYYDVAFVKTIQDDAKVTFPETGPYSSLSFVAGRSMLMAQFVSLMGIEPDILQFLPIGSIFVSITLYFLALRLLKSPVIACLITLYLTINLSHATALYSVFGYALALPLYLGLIIICIRLFEKRGQREILLLLVLFMAVHLIHYTLAIWMILFLIGASLTIQLQKWLASQATIKAMPIYYLALAFSVIYLAFNEVIYQSFLPLVEPETLDSALQRFLFYLSVDPTSINRSPYQATRSGIIGIITALSLLLILIPIALGFLSDLWHLIVKRSSKYIANPDLPIIWGTLLMGVTDSLSYAIRGSISTKSFSMVFPILTLLYVRRSGKQPLYIGVAILLLATSLLKIIIFYDNSYVIGPNKMAASPVEIQPSTQWIHDHLPQSQYTMLADMNLYGKYLNTSLEQNQEPLLLGFTVETYEKVVGDSTEKWQAPPDVVAIDQTSLEPIVGFVWARLDPLNMYNLQVQNNPSLRQVIYRRDILQLLH